MNVKEMIIYNGLTVDELLDISVKEGGLEKYLSDNNLEEDFEKTFQFKFKEKLARDYRDKFKNYTLSDDELLELKNEFKTYWDIYIDRPDTKKYIEDSNFRILFFIRCFGRNDEYTIANFHSTLIYLNDMDKTFDNLNNTYDNCGNKLDGIGKFMEQSLY